jgi:plastocyanin
VADEPKAEDKSGNEISVGDKVAFVYGGDYHEVTVESINTSSGIAWLTVTPEPVEIPAGSANLIEKAKKSSSSKSSKSESSPEAAAAASDTPDSRPQTPDSPTKGSK